MSIRLQNDGILDSAVSGSGRLPETGASNPSGGKPGGEPSGTNGFDRVEVSSFSESLSNAGSQAELERTAKLNRLAAAYASGNYQADPAQTASALVSQALIAGGSAE